MSSEYNVFGGEVATDVFAWFSLIAEQTAPGDFNRANNARGRAPVLDHILPATLAHQSREAERQPTNLALMASKASNSSGTSMDLHAYQYEAKHSNFAVNIAENRQDKRAALVDVCRRILVTYVQQATKYQSLLEDFARVHFESDETLEGEHAVSENLVRLADVLGEPAIYAMAAALRAHRPGDPDIGIIAAHLAAMRDKQTQALRIELLERLGASHEPMDRYHAISGLGMFDDQLSKVSLRHLADREQDQSLKQMALDFSGHGDGAG